MNAHSVKHNLELQRWAEIVRRRNESGMKILDFCKQEGFSKDTYYYWLRKLREQELLAHPELLAEPETALVTAAPALVKLRPPVEIHAPEPERLTSSMPASFSPKLMLQMNGAVIGVDEHTPRELLATVVEVLKSV